MSTMSLSAPKGNVDLNIIVSAREAWGPRAHARGARSQAERR
jgi:hypothetical protein